MLDQLQFLFNALSDSWWELWVALLCTSEGFLPEIIEIFPSGTEQVTLVFDRLKIEGKLALLQELLRIEEQVAVVFAASDELSIAVELVRRICLFLHRKLAE